MFLSRMYLNPRRRGTVGLLANPQAMHGAVRSCFPPILEPSSEGRILWRLDENGDKVALYIASPMKPSFEHIQEQAGWANAESWTIHSYARVLDNIVSGQRFGFQLRANPTRTVTDPQTGHKYRRAHVTNAQCLTWLTDRAETLGVSFPFEEETQQPLIEVVGRTQKQVKRRGKVSPLVMADYRGVVQVEDAARFRHALTSGIGHGRAYGCGLFTVVPLKAD